MIRERQGKHPVVQSTPARVFEQRVSSLRKTVTAHEKTVPEICDQLGQPDVQSFLSDCTIAEVSQIINLHRCGFELCGKDALPALLSFATQSRYSTFFEFLVDKKYHQRTLLQETFLNSLGVDPASTYTQSYLASCTGFPPNYRNLSAHGKSAYLGGLVHAECVKGYELEFAAWNPSSHFNSLVSIVRERGAAVAFGDFGHKCYDAPPLLLAEQAGTHRVYGWRPASIISKDSMVGHVITVVGCEQRAGDKARIYYLDPDDGSSAQQQRKVYTLSYQSFVGRCADIYGICGPSPTPNGYLVTRKR